MHTERTFSVPYRHALRVSQDAFDPADASLADAFAGHLDDPSGPARVMVAIDSGVLDANPDLPDRIRARFAPLDARATLAEPVYAIPGGESCKNDPGALDDLLRAIHDAHLCRRSYLLVIGGGAALDLAGFAATTAHRGIRLIRIPTTTVGQGDSGVGVKNGVNRFGKKNYLGAFGVPHMVINDLSLLATLTDEHWVSGFSECVKVALLKDRALFERIERDAALIRARDMDASAPVIERSAVLHLDHIALGGDPFELNAARPLDFGHWAAHKLEQVTNFQLAHGHAVAIGLALDLAYARAIGLLDPVIADRATTCLASLGFTLHHPAMAQTDALLDGLEEFREHLGGQLTITLIDDIASPVDVHEIDERAMTEAAQALARAEAARVG